MSSPAKPRVPDFSRSCPIKAHVPWWPARGPQPPTSPPPPEKKRASCRGVGGRRGALLETRVHLPPLGPSPSGWALVPFPGEGRETGFGLSFAEQSSQPDAISSASSQGPSPAATGGSRGGECWLRVSDLVGLSPDSECWSRPGPSKQGCSGGGGARQQWGGQGLLRQPPPPGEAGAPPLPPLPVGIGAWWKVLPGAPGCSSA